MCHYFSAIIQEGQGALEPPIEGMRVGRACANSRLATWSSTFRNLSNTISFQYNLFSLPGVFLFSTAIMLGLLFKQGTCMVISLSVTVTAPT